MFILTYKAITPPKYWGHPLALEGLFSGFLIFFEIFEISEILDTSSKLFGEMFKGDSADTWGGKFSLLSMGGRAEGPSCVDPGARTWE